jgi:hypothetical protein
MKKLILFIAIGLLVGGTAMADSVELIVNGDFETGDFTGWTRFGNANVLDDGTGLNFRAQIFENDPSDASSIKQSNMGQGVVISGNILTLSFEAGGGDFDGGAVVTVFTESVGGNVTSGVFPLVLPGFGADPYYGAFEFQVEVGYDIVTGTTGNDASGGVSVLFSAFTDGDGLSGIDIDNVSMTTDVTVSTEATTMDGIKSLYR